MSQQSHDIDKFTADLLKLVKKHGIKVSGTLRLLDSGYETMQHSVSESLELQPGIFDRMGPFVKLWADKEHKVSDFKPNKVNTQIMDKDKLLANGVLSPITQEPFSNRADYKDHLKRHGCVEIGNDFNNAKEIPGKLRGDFDVRQDLSRATYEVMEKYGH